MNNKPACVECINNHVQENPDNYCWLWKLGHGRVVTVWFEEPVNSGNWKIYTPQWWETHCRIVDHGSNLYESHMKAFVWPGRFARLIFRFEDGFQAESNSTFYELEQVYFDNLNLCRYIQAGSSNQSNQSNQPSQYNQYNQSNQYM